MPRGGSRSGAGRPASGGSPRTTSVRVFLTDREAAELAALATSWGVTEAEAIRRLLRDACHTHRDSDGRAVARIVGDVDTTD